MSKKTISQITIKDSINLKNTIQKDEIKFYLHLEEIKEFERWKEKSYYIDEWEKDADVLINGSFNNFLNIVFRTGEWWITKIGRICSKNNTKFPGQEYLIKYGSDDCSFLIGLPKTEVKKIISEVNKTGRRSPFYIIHRELYPEKYVRKIKNDEDNSEETIQKTTDISDNKWEKKYEKLLKEFNELKNENGLLKEKLKSYEIILGDYLENKKVNKK